MKTGTLLQSFLLAAGLMLGGTSAVLADSVYGHGLRSGDYHSSAHNNRCCRHKAARHDGHRHDRGHHYAHYGKPREKHHKGHHDSRDRWGKHRDRDNRRYGGFDRWHGGRHHG